MRNFVFGALCTTLVLSTPSPSLAQDQVISGVVADAETQRPLEAVEVRIDGTRLRTVTDGAGRFRITVGAGGQDRPGLQLVLHRLGYRTSLHTVTPGGPTLRLFLTQSAIELDELIVTGTPGATQKRALGNSVAKIDASRVRELAPVTDVLQLLNGRVPGVIVMPFSGNVGTGAVTRVRGPSSLALSNEPLIYIDGVRVNNSTRRGPAIRQGRQVSRLSDIPPEDIESIEIIKGPAAATLYGTEASHGVIQVITRKGVEGRPLFTVSIGQGANWFMNPGGRLATFYARDPVTGAIDSLNLYRQEEAAGRPFFSTGRTQSYTLSARGGTDNVRYYLSGEFDDDVGAVTYNWRKRAGMRANVQVVPNDNVRIESSVGFMRNNARLAQSAPLWDLMTQLTWGSPLQRDLPTRGFFRTTPEDAATIEAGASNNRFIGSARIEFEPWPWLAQRLTVGTDIDDETSSLLFPRHPAGSSGPFGPISEGEKTLERRATAFHTVDYGATATVGLTRRLRSATSVGAQYYVKYIADTGVTGRTFPDPDVTVISGAATTTGSETRTENKTAGVFAQEQLEWNNRIFLTGALRADDNSAFGSNFDVVVYPKVSGSWILHEEPFWKVSFLNELKLRAAWGMAGQQPDVFAAERTYAPSTGPGDVAVVTPQNVGNPDLKPERSEELEVGFDAGALTSRLGIGFTYYTRRTKDAIAARRLPPSNGFPGTQFVNVGEIRNSGYELSLDARLLDSEKLSLNLGAALARNDGRVVSLGGLPTIVVGAATGVQHVEGYPLSGYWRKVIVSAELNPNGTAVNIMCDGGPQNGGNPVPCASAPSVYVGQPEPRWQGSTTATLTLFQNLRLYGLVDFKTGHVAHQNDADFAHHDVQNTLAINLRSDPILMATHQLGGAAGGYLSSGFLRLGFAKLREVAASYTLPARWFGTSGRRASIGISGRNLAILWQQQKDAYGFPNIDPEIRSGGAVLDTQSNLQNLMPQLAHVTTTFRLTF